MAFVNKCQNKCNELQKDLLFLNNGLKFVDVNYRDAFNEFNQIGLTKFVVNEVEEPQMKKSKATNENKINKTKEEREKIVKKALAIANADGRVPTDDAIQLAKKYIDGEMELDQIKNEIIKLYNENI